MRFLLVLSLLFCAIADGTPFEWKAVPAGNTLTVSVKIEPGYYFQTGSFIMEVADGTTRIPQQLSAPLPRKISDPDRGTIEIIPSGTWQWIFQGIPPYKVKVSFQGCRKGASGEPALCLMPQTLRLLPADTPIRAAESAAVRAFYSSWRTLRSRSGAMNEAELTAFLNEKDSAVSDRTSTGVILLMIFAFLGGIGLNLTPCVLPMIPVNLAIIGAKGSRSAGFRRGSLYGLGMALAYGTLGAVAVLTGRGFGILNSTSWFNFAIGILFIALSCAMFGIFNFDLSRYRLAPDKLRAGGDIGAFLMGGVAALLAGACVAPVVASVLMLAAKLYAEGIKSALFLGFLLGLGMALPWPFAGAGLALLPKPGKFMVIIKMIFGVLILCCGLYYTCLGWSLLPEKNDPAAELVKLENAAVRARAEKKLLCVWFHASWCGNCKEMERSVLKNQAVQRALGKYVFVPFQAEKPGDPLIAPLLKRWQVPGFPCIVILDPEE